MPQRRRGGRVLGERGPLWIRDRERWRVVTIAPSGERFSREFDDEDVARRYWRDAWAEIRLLTEKTVQQAIDAYEVHQREKGNKPGSIATSRQRLETFFPDGRAPLANGEPVKGWAGRDTRLVHVDAKMAEGLYAAVRARRARRTDRALAVDTHREILREASLMMGWCVAQKWRPANPLAEVQGVGRRKAGKAQLSADEARAWLHKAIEIAEAGESGAVAAMMCLVMGMRSGEVVGRLVRDLDANGTIIRIENAKTAAGNRPLEVPEFMQPLLQRVVKGKGPLERIFGTVWRTYPLRWTKRICERAGVPTVTAHGLRGTHSTLAVEAGATSHLVASALGHTSFAITERHYAKAEAVSGARQRRALEVLSGGKR